MYNNNNEPVGGNNVIPFANPNCGMTFCVNE